VDQSREQLNETYNSVNTDAFDDNGDIRILDRYQVICITIIVSFILLKYVVEIRTSI